LYLLECLRFLPYPPSIPSHLHFLAYLWLFLIAYSPLPCLVFILIVVFNSLPLCVPHSLVTALPCTLWVTYRPLHAAIWFGHLGHSHYCLYPARLNTVNSYDSNGVTLIPTLALEAEKQKLPKICLHAFSWDPLNTPEHIHIIWH